MSTPKNQGGPPDKKFWKFSDKDKKIDEGLQSAYAEDNGLKQVTLFQDEGLRGVLTDVHTQLKVDTKHLQQLDKDVILAQQKAQRELKERTAQLDKDLTKAYTEKITGEVAIRDKKFGEIDVELKQFEKFDVVTADIAEQRKDHEELKEKNEEFQDKTDENFDVTNDILNKIRVLVHPEEFDVFGGTEDTIESESAEENLTGSERASPMDEQMMGLTKIPTLSVLVKKTNKAVHGNASGKPMKKQWPAVYYRKDALQFLIEQNSINKSMGSARNELAQHVFRMLAQQENQAQEAGAKFNSLKEELVKLMKNEIKAVRQDMKGINEEVENTNEAVENVKKVVDDVQTRMGEMEEETEAFREQTLAAQAATHAAITSAASSPAHAMTAARSGAASPEMQMQMMQPQSADPGAPTGNNTEAGSVVNGGSVTPVPGDGAQVGAPSMLSAGTSQMRIIQQPIFDPVLVQSVEMLKTKFATLQKRVRMFDRDFNDHKLKTEVDRKLMKKLENRVCDVESYAELPELEDVLIEGKPVETKEVLLLIKSVQKDMHMKFVTDGKLMPVNKAIDDLQNKMNDLQIELAHQGGDPTGASLGQEPKPIILSPQIVVGKVDEKGGRTSSMSGTGGGKSIQPVIITQPAFDLSGNEDWCDMQAQMTIIPKKINQNNSAIQRNDNMIFGLNNQVDKILLRLNEVDKAMKMSADLAAAITMRGDMPPGEFISTIVQNQAALAAQMVDKETFDAHVNNLNDIKTQIKVQQDFKKQHTEEFDEFSDNWEKFLMKNKEEVEKLEDLVLQQDLIKRTYVNKNEWEALDDEISELRVTFLEGLQKAAETEQGPRISSKAFMNVVQKKQKKEPDGLTRSDKAKFKMLLEKWEVMEQGQKKNNEMIRKAVGNKDSGNLKKLEKALLNKADEHDVQVAIGTMQDTTTAVSAAMTEFREQNAAFTMTAIAQTEELTKMSQALLERMDGVESNIETLQEGHGKLRRGVNKGSLALKLKAKVDLTKVILDQKKSQQDEADAAVQQKVGTILKQEDDTVQQDDGVPEQQLLQVNAEEQNQMEVSQGEPEESDDEGVPSRAFQELEEKVRRLAMGLGFDSDAQLPGGMARHNSQSEDDMAEDMEPVGKKDLYSRLKKLLNKFLEEHQKTTEDCLQYIQGLEQQVVDMEKSNSRTRRGGMRRHQSSGGLYKNTIPYAKKGARGGHGFGFGQVGGQGRLPFQETGDRIARYGRGFSNLLNLANQNQTAKDQAHTQLGSPIDTQTQATVNAYNTLATPPHQSYNRFEDTEGKYQSQYLQVSDAEGQVPSSRTIDPNEALLKYRAGGNVVGSSVIGGAFDGFELHTRKLSKNTNGGQLKNRMNRMGLNVSPTQKRFVHGTGFQNSPMHSLQKAILEASDQKIFNTPGGGEQLPKIYENKYTNYEIAKELQQSTKNRITGTKPSFLNVQ